MLFWTFVPQLQLNGMISIRNDEFVMTYKLRIPLQEPSSFG